MDPTIKEATVPPALLPAHDSLRTHLGTFLEACNFAKHLKSPHLGRGY
jgi:hypothetical protein